MRILLKSSIVLTVLAVLTLFAICEGALRKQKKVRCHPSCCHKPKKPKSLLGRYMVDLADDSDGRGDDIVDLAYVLLKVAKGTYNDYQASMPSFRNGTNYEEYRYEDNMIPNSPISYDMFEAAQRSAVRTRYAPGNGVAAALGTTVTSMFSPGGKKSIFSGLTPQVNLDKNRFLGLNVSSQAAVAVSIFYSYYRGGY